MNGSDTVVAASQHEGRTILATFAGRRDRMRLLEAYARAAIDRGIIDEWHVWDFSRNPQDAAWLAERFPDLRMTPGDRTAYAASGRTCSVGQDGGRMTLRVRAKADAHVGLFRHGDGGPSFELCLGGFGNSKTMLRALASRAELESRDGGLLQRSTIAFVDTPRLLSPYAFREVTLELRSGHFSVAVDGRAVLDAECPIGESTFDLMHMSGHGADAEWIFDVAQQPRILLFRAQPVEPQGGRQQAPPYTPFYDHYTLHEEEYEDAIFLKCDDDIVFVDLERLPAFIAFRREHPEYFLVSADVVNNGICAHFQATRGLLPASLGEFELPPNGFGGSVWASGVRAGAIHRQFLDDPSRFRTDAAETIVHNERISINFVAWLGSDLRYIPYWMQDDEHELSYQVRRRAQKQNCIRTGFCVAHLSFFSQEETLDVEGVVEAYATLMQRELAQRAGQ